jgi:ABC-type amino acid transport substrate-binding protein
MMLLRGRVDVAVVSRSYLRTYQQRYPEQSQALLVSQRVDQVYQLQALFRQQSAISPPVFADLFKQLNRDQQLDRLLNRYHLRDLSLQENN